MEPLITMPLKEWEAVKARIDRAENELKQIYSALAPLQPARNADEWGMNLVNILIARLTVLEKIVAAQHGVQADVPPSAEPLGGLNETQS